MTTPTVEILTSSPSAFPPPPQITDRRSSTLWSLRYVSADWLEVIPRHPLRDLVSEDGSLDDRGAVVHTVVNAGVDDFLDDLVRTVEVMCIRCSSGQIDAARQTLRAEEFLDCVRV